MRRPYVSTYEGYYRMTEQPRSESVSAQRDRANASAQEAWQSNAELREALLGALAILGAIAALRGTAIGAVLFPKTHDKVFDDIDEVCNRARALLAKGSTKP